MTNFLKNNRISIKGFTENLVNNSAFPVFIEDCILNLIYLMENNPDMDAGKAFSDGNYLKKYARVLNAFTLLENNGVVKKIIHVNSGNKVKYGYLNLMSALTLDVKPDFVKLPPLENMIEWSINFLNTLEKFPYSVMKLTAFINYAFKSYKRVNFYCEDVESFLKNNPHIFSKLKFSPFIK